METRRAILRRSLRATLGGAAAALLAACSSPVQITFPSPTVLPATSTATPATSPTLAATQEPPRARPAAPMGAGVGGATPVGTPRIPEGFARSRLRIIHASPILPALVLTIDNVEIGTARYPEATAYTDILFGTRRIAGLSATGQIFAAEFDARDDVTYTVVLAVDGTGPRALILPDDQPPPAAGHCQIRFLPLDSSAGPLDLAVANGPTLATGVAPFTVGPSVALPIGSPTLDVRAPGRAEPLLTKPPVALDAGDRYTAVLSGRTAAQSLRLLLYPDATLG
jgi:hypothetical protein